MFPTTFRVVVDACVLSPMNLRDTLLRAAGEGYFQLYWSNDILDEMERNLVKNGVMAEEKAASLRAQMNAAFPESMVVGHMSLVPSMPNQEKDRHVAAAAVKAGAQVIVTNNLRDFRELPDGIEAQTPDEFLCNLFDLNPDEMVELLIEQASSRKKPPVSFDMLLEAMAKAVPDFIGVVRQHVRTRE